MTLWVSVLLAVIALLFGFIRLNWTEFSTPSPLAFGFTAVQMPVGFVMLGVLVAVLALFSAFVMYHQVSCAIQQGQVFNALEPQRKIANQAANIVLESRWVYSTPLGARLSKANAVSHMVPGSQMLRGLPRGWPFRQMV